VHAAVELNRAISPDPAAPAAAHWPAGQHDQRL